MKAVAVMAVAICLLAGCTRDYYEVKKEDLHQAFIVNSSPTFRGYFYQGSDTTHHYFISRWKYSSDRRLKIRKADLQLSGEKTLGHKETRVCLLKPDNADVEPFAVIGQTTIYIGEQFWTFDSD